jgi:hypothetical protein
MDVIIGCGNRSNAEIDTVTLVGFHQQLLELTLWLHVTVIYKQLTTGMLQFEAF